MAIVAHTRPFVIGVYTHARNHSFTILTAATGEQIAAKQFPTTPAGLNRAVDWVSCLIGGDLTALWAIEGAATYGARLARIVTDAGYEMAEAPPHGRTGRIAASASQTSSMRTASALRPCRSRTTGYGAPVPMTTCAQRYAS